MLILFERVRHEVRQCADVLIFWFFALDCAFGEQHDKHDYIAHLRTYILIILITAAVGGIRIIVESE